MTSKLSFKVFRHLSFKSLCTRGIFQDQTLLSRRFDLNASDRMNRGCLVTPWPVEKCLSIFRVQFQILRNTRYTRLLVNISSNYRSLFKNLSSVLLQVIARVCRRRTIAEYFGSLTYTFPYNLCIRKLLGISNLRNLLFNVNKDFFRMTFQFTCGCV